MRRAYLKPDAFRCPLCREPFERMFQIEACRCGAVPVAMSGWMCEACAERRFEACAERRA